MSLARSVQENGSRYQVQCREAAKVKNQNLSEAEQVDARGTATTAVQG